MSKNNAHKKKHKAVFVILLILGILIFLFGITGLFAAPPFGIAFMVVGVAITIPFFVSGGKQKPVTVAKNESDVFNFENISIDEVVSKSVEAGRKGGLVKQKLNLWVKIIPFMSIQKENLLMKDMKMKRFIIMTLIHIQLN